MRTSDNPHYRPLRYPDPILSGYGSSVLKGPDKRGGTARIWGGYVLAVMY